MIKTLKRRLNPMIDLDRAKRIMIAGAVTIGFFGGIFVLIIILNFIIDK